MSQKPNLLRRTVLLAGCAVVAMSGAQFASAQDTANGQLEEIVVTAQKRGENIQEVPAGVTAISTQLLNDLHATQLVDIGSYVPSLQINSGGSPGQTTISIRGIAPVGPGATVATYIDESPVGSSSAYGGGIAFALDLLPYDVERLEVLRGPQGTLYGASSMGGLLKYVLTEPVLDEMHVKVGGDMFGMASAGNPGGGARAMISGPIIDGELGFTASYAREETPGFIDNPLLGKTDQNGYLQQSGRLGLYWKPNEDLSVKLNALYQQVDSDGNAQVALDPTTLQPLVGQRSDNNLTDQPFKKQIGFYSASIDYKMPWAEFVSATSYADTRTNQTIDESYIYGVAFPFFGLPAGTSQSPQVLHLQKFTQEFRLQSLPGTSLDWLGGVFVTNEDSINDQSPSALTATGKPIPAINPIFAAQLPSTYTEYAFFGDLTYHVTDQADIFGGVRYSHNDQTFSEIAQSVILGNVDLRDQKSSEGVATFSAGTRYRFTNQLMAYLRIASGYQPGGPNLAIAGIPPQFSPDTLTSYEVGLKSQFLDNRVLVDVDAFYIDWNDIQLLSNVNGINHNANGGTAKSQGVEANVSVRPITGLTVDGTFAFVDAVLSQDAPDIGGLNGDRLPNIPRFSGSLRATYSYGINDDWTGTLGAGLRLVGQRYSDVNHASDSRSISGYGALDLDASVSDDRYTIRVFAKNLTDTHAYLTYVPLVNGATNGLTQIEATVLQPRVVGVSIDAKF
jgi:iron complex outermembrane receptor protein